jgi:hypothetical protein
MPSFFAQIWPMVALLGLACLAVPTVAWAYQSAALPVRARVWLTRHYRASLLVLIVVVALAGDWGRCASGLPQLGRRECLPVPGRDLPRRPIVEPASAGR